MTQKKQILYMLDTNTVSHIIKNTMPHIHDHLEAVPMTSLCISAITEAEIQYGLAKKPEAKTLHQLVKEFLQRVDVLPWDSEVAEHYGKFRAEIEKQGRSLSNLDLLIAAHASAVNATLVISDKAFSQVKSLHLCDWSKPFKRTN
jgi:tRNA(fMet)-specific endonuclease VapC